MLANRNAFGQTQMSKADSLSTLLATARDAGKKADLLLKLAKLSEKSSLAQAIDYANQALTVINEGKVDSLFASANSTLGSLYFYKGSYNQALEKFNTELNWHIARNNYNQIITTQINVGAVYHIVGDTDKARNTYLNSLEYLINNRAKYSIDLYNRSLLTLYNNLGNIENETGNNVKGKEWYFKGLQLAEQVNSIEQQGRISHNLGKLYLEEVKYDSAKVYLKRAIIHRRLHGNNAGEANTLMLLSNLYFFTNKIDSALVYNKKAYNLAELSNSSDIKIQCYKTFVKIYKANKDYKNAFEAQEKFVTLYDSIYSSQVKNEIFKLQYDNDLSIQKYKLKIEQQEKENKYLVVLASMILIIGVVGIIYFMLRSRYNRLKYTSNLLELNKVKLETEVELRNKELTTNVLYMVQKNEILANVIERLIEAKKNLKPENQPIIQNILQDLSSLLNDNVWSEFEIRFQNVHLEFYEKLQSKFPDLSTNERKLCAFLRLNMTTKEISAITNQNVNSIEMARHRLRKKLNIDNTQVNLTTFLMEL
jgi:DNA-binding CsgD family transcriptional regulator/lipopolysaccharide biosynthesis regulator YciM